VSVYTVRQLRARYGWYRSVASSRRGVDIDGQLTVSGLADRLGVTKHWIYYRIHNECIDPKYITRHPVYKVLLIQDDPELIEFLQQQVALTACDNGGI
jgi:hypothetical protein